MHGFLQCLGCEGKQRQGWEIANPRLQDFQCHPEMTLVLCTDFAIAKGMEGSTVVRLAPSLF